MKTPQAPPALVNEIFMEQLRRDGHKFDPRCGILAVRPYWPKSMGPTRGNDVNIYDDAMFFFCKEKGIFLPQQANTDPSRYGWNSGAGKPMAVLNTGTWFFRRGPHRGKTPAFRQFTPEEAESHNAKNRNYHVPNDGRFAVTRTYSIGDKRNYVEAGYYAINIHPGGVNGTSSEGCQTIPREAAQRFLRTAWDVSMSCGVHAIPYVLVDGPIN